ncbi:hypothetical protein [Limosilactobacillus urinaemulieris]|uniref:hypothetical protein n=1 Tax=Limosilactobacillus urinaemulieris TaxID=2742600 RepID=UPI0028E64EDB|nr:hypothetical protein [Limosilactobacillus urinaemulieris]
MLENKCPFCGSKNYGRIQPPVGDGFVISCASQKDGILDAGMPVVLYGCKDCNCIWMASNAFGDHE